MNYEAYMVVKYSSGSLANSLRQEATGNKCVDITQCMHSASKVAPMANQQVRVMAGGTNAVRSH